MRVAHFAAGGDRPEAFEDLLGIDQSGEGDVADIFGGIGGIGTDCWLDFYHEYGVFYAVEPHFFVAIEKTEVELLDVRRPPPGGVAPLATYPPDAPNFPAVG